MLPGFGASLDDLNTNRSTILSAFQCYQQFTSVSTYRAVVTVAMRCIVQQLAQKYKNVGKNLSFCLKQLHKKFRQTEAITPFYGAIFSNAL